MMGYLVANKAGEECIFAGRPVYESDIDCWIVNEDGHFDYGYCKLPKGTVEKIIGRKLPYDECFLLNTEGDVTVEESIEFYEKYKEDEL